MHGNQVQIEIEKELTQNTRCIIRVNCESFWGDTFSTALKSDIYPKGTAREKVILIDQWATKACRKGGCFPVGNRTAERWEKRNRYFTNHMFPDKEALPHS